MAKLGWRVRSLAWALAHAPGSVVSQMTAEQMVRAQQRLAANGRLATGVVGSLAKGVVTDNRTIRRHDHDLPIRVYRPVGLATGGPVIVHFHGGGWTLGALDQSDWLCSQVSLGVGAVVVSVDYRLAPTHHFPMAVVDSVDARRIGVMGDSAGGNLATVVCQILRDSGGPAIAHQALMYPATDLRTPADFDAAHPARTDFPILPSASMLSFRDHYLGPDGDANDPMASPILAEDLSGLPPALVQVAEYDPLRDDGIRYARAMQAAGTTVRLTEYVGMPHGYFSFPKVIRGSVVQALAELCAEQRYALHADPVPTAFPRVPAGLPEKTADADPGKPGSPVDPIASRPVEDHPVGQYPVPQHSAD